VPLNRFVGIFGAGGQMAALPADQTRQAELIATDGPMGRLLDRARHLSRARDPARLDLVQGIHDGVEGQQNGGMAGLVVP
jgi:hypothetical protein